MRGEKLRTTARTAKSRGKKRETWPREKLNSSTDANVPMERASAHPSDGVKKKKSLAMDHHASKRSTAPKTQLATKPFFLQTFCLGWKMQHEDVCGEGRPGASSCAGRELLPSLCAHHSPPLPSPRPGEEQTPVSCRGHPQHSTTSAARCSDPRCSLAVCLPPLTTGWKQSLGVGSPPQPAAS